MPAPPSTSQVSLPSQNGATEFIIRSCSCSVCANGNNPIPRSKPSRITYIATANPISAAQITGRYDSMGAASDGVLAQYRHSSLGAGLSFASALPARGRYRRSTAAGLERGIFRSVRYQPVDGIDAHREHDAVDEHEQHKCRGDGMGGER